MKSNSCSLVLTADNSAICKSYAKSISDALSGAILGEKNFPRKTVFSLCIDRDFTFDDLKSFLDEFISEKGGAASLYPGSEDTSFKGYTSQFDDGVEYDDVKFVNEVMGKDSSATDCWIEPMEDYLALIYLRRD